MLAPPDRNITIDLDGSARTWLANRGYEPAYGARPLKWVIQKFVQDPLAEAILAGRAKDGEIVSTPLTLTLLKGRGFSLCSDFQNPIQTLAVDYVTTPITGDAVS